MQMHLQEKGFEALQEVSEEIASSLSKKQKEDEDHPKIKANEVLFGCRAQQRDLSKREN